LTDHFSCPVLFFFLFSLITSLHQKFRAAEEERFLMIKKLISDVIYLSKTNEETKFQILKDAQQLCKLIDISGDIEIFCDTHVSIFISRRDI